MTGGRIAPRLVMVVAACLACGILFASAAHSQKSEDAAALDAAVQRLRQAGKYAEATETAKRLLAIREKKLGPKHPDVGMALVSLATLYHDQRDPEAEPLYKRSLAIFEEALGPEDPIVDFLVNNLAALYQDQGRYTEAEQFFKRSLAIREKVVGPDDPLVGASLNYLGQLYRTQGRYAEAEPLHKRGLAIREKALGRDHLDVGKSLNYLGLLYQDQGRYREAEPLYKRGLAIREKALGPDHLDVATSINNLAALYQAQARYNEAEPLHKRTVAIFEKALGPDHRQVGTVLNNLAALYQDQARYSDAEPLFKRAVTIFERALGPEHPDVGAAYNNLALSYRNQGRYSEAEPHFKRDLAIREKALGPEHPSVATPVSNLALLYRDQGRYAEAEALHERDLAIREKALGPEHPSVATSLGNLALLLNDQGRYDEGERLLKGSLAISEKALGPDHPHVEMALGNLAELAFSQNDWAGAAGYWRRSTSIIKRRAKRGLAGSGRSSGGEARQWARQFSGLVKVTSRLEQGPRAAVAAEIFETAQWAQGSETATSLAQMAARSAKGSPQLAGLARERQDMVVEWNVKDNLLIAAKSEAPARRNADAEKVLADRLAAIDTRLAEIDRRFARDFPDYAALASPTPVSVDEAQAQLGVEEALVLFLDTPEWKPSPEESFIWVLTKTETRWVRSELGTAALAREVAALRCGLDATAWNGGGAEKCAEALDIPLHKAPGPNQPLPFDHSRAHKLYSALFGEVQDLIKGKHLLIVPSGPLTQLPLQVLVTKPPASRDHRVVAWLARDHAVTVLPAVSSLKALRRVGRPSTASKPMIGFGNPLLDGPDARYASRAKLAREKQRCPAGSLRVAALAGLRGGVQRVETRSGLTDVSYIKMQVPLPETTDELCAVAQDVKAETRDIRLGTQATEAEIKRLSASGELAKYRMVHFATHGVLAGQLDGTHEPGLILTPPDKATEEDDGYLSASEIAALKLDADWVILSACNTAAGAATSAEALSGLARAFIYAQARALLVSHWEVYSDATVKLITTAIREMARDPNVGRAEALRRSMLALIDKGEPHEAHPAYWAPFVVVGEGGAINAGGSPTNNVVLSPARKIVRKPVRETRDWATDLLRPN